MNSQPVFEDLPETKFLLAFNETLTYHLPATYDPEGNAKAEVLIESYVGYEDLFPPFLATSNSNWTLSFNVNNAEYAGKEYFFKIILKEEGLDVIGNPYYCSVLIDPIDSTDGSGDDKKDDDSTNNQDGGDGTGTNTGGNEEGTGDSTGDVPSGRTRRGIVLETDSYKQLQKTEK